ncbi:DUF7507 domain-containing protein [Paenibacillus albus]|uniref:DUF11 domain-containing protein n=1 Tax=Paenibacillus albus TaxID=2495582 RepID=A0A3Q8X637_9BACL|nr:SdrD B-like domain-containing protein [Paenibacillus albus]AZN41232.1 DUF11 domain-containing protein [Paenibacillus albus]
MPALVTGIVFNDLNHNGVFNPGEPGIPNVFVVLFSNAGGTCTSIQTDAGGNYTFQIVTPGTYTIYETVANPGLTCPPTAFTQPAGFTMSNGPRKLTITVTNAQIVGNVVLGNNNFSHDTNTNSLACTTSMIQFSGRPTVWFNINIVTGTAIPQGTVNPPLEINAIGYNTLDNYIYGYDQLNNNIVRVDNSGNVIVLSPLPPGLPVNTYNVGTFDLNGFLYISSNELSRFFVIDLRPNSSTFMKLVNPANGFQEQTSNFGVALSRVLNVSDWVFRPQDGNLYGITPTGIMQRIVPATGAISNVTTSPQRTGPFGAIALDATGTIYAISNSDGNIYRYTIAGNTASAAVFSSTITTSFNDATMCTLATINLDFGDAPDTSAGNGPDNYSTLLESNGPRHGIVNNLRLGTQITAEANALQNSDATGDDIPLGIQDDGLLVPLPGLPFNATQYSISVRVTNTTGSPANLYGWVDFNGDGIFQANEAAPVAVVPSLAGVQTIPLVFSITAGITQSADHTFARLRLTTDTLVNDNLSVVPAPPPPDTRSLGPATDGEVEDYNVQIAVPVQLDILKVPFPLQALPGDPITYRISVKNPASFALTNVRIEDTLLGLIDILSILPANSAVELTATFIVPPDALAGTLIPNTVTATSDQSLPAQADAIISVLPVFSMTITKSPDRITVPAGDIVTYTIIVTNTSNTSITNVIVKDDLVGLSETIPVLAPGEARQFLVPFRVPPGAFAGTTFTNLTVAQSDQADPVSDTATIIVPPIPSIFIFKSVEPQIAAPGETVTYTITVSNAGNQTLTNVHIVDPQLSVDQIYDALKPGDSVIITVPFVIPLTAGQGDTIVNISTVTTDQTGPAQSNAVVEVLGQPEITLAKSVSPQDGFPGDPVVYTFVVSNTGNTVLTNVVLTDPLIGVNLPIGTLAVSEIRSFDVPFIVPNTASPFINRATATGNFNTLTVTASDDAALTILPVNAAFTLEKSVDQPLANAGDTVSFTFTITNIGNVPLTSVVIDDPLLSFSTTIISLESGASVTETIPFVIPDSAAAGTVFTNVVTVTTTETGPQQATATVTVDDAPALTLSKTPDVDNVLPGGTINYTITVTNTGNVPLTNVTVRDALLGISTVIPLLAVGASQSLTPAFIVPLATPVDTVIVNLSTAFSDQTDTIAAEAHVLVNPLPPVMTVTKTSDVLTAAPGDTITYTITIANPGTIILTGIVLTDDVLGVAVDIGTLDPGGSQVLNFFFIVPEGTPAGSTIINTAVATSDQTNPSEATVSVLVDPSPAISIVKTSDIAEAAPGEEVIFTIVVENTGNTSLTDVTVSDATLSFNVIIPSLPIGGNLVIPIPFITPIVPAGTVLTNTATASSNETEPASSTAEVTVLPEFLLTLLKRVEPASALPGETVTFFFEIQNSSNAALTNLHFLDPLLGIDKTVETVPAGFTVLLSRTFTIPADAIGGTIITNEAELSSDQTAPVIATADVAVIAAPELTISKTVFPPVALPGEVVFFRMQGVNTGNVPLFNISFNDPLLGLVGTVVSQDIGETLSLIVPFTVPADTVPGSTIVNTVLVGSEQTGLLSASATVRVIGLPLSVTKSADRPNIFVGDRVRFTIIVANQSDITVTDAIVNDVLQDGTRFVPGSVQINRILAPGANPAQGISIGNLAPGHSVEVSFLAEQLVALQGERLRNQASVIFSPEGTFQRFTIRSNVVDIRVEENEE